MIKLELKQNFTNLLDFFLPRYCAGCNTKLTNSEGIICKECFNNISLADSTRLQYEFDRKFSSSDIIKDFFSAYVFEKDGTLQNIIHSLKYNKKFLAGILLGKKLAEAISTKSQRWKIDLIIPVPLHHLKKAERGYNQSGFIAKGLSRNLKIPFSNRAVKRVRYTESQTKLHQSEREENIAGAFKVKQKKKIEGKNLLLVDDVITTGSTIKECGKVLLDNGAKAIYACSVAIAD